MDSLLNCRHKSDRKSSYGDAVEELDSAVGEIIDLLVKMKIENKVGSRQYYVQIAFGINKAIILDTGCFHQRQWSCENFHQVRARRF